VAVTNGTVSAVTLIDDTGAPVAGSLRTDGTAWVPAAPLTYGKAYTASVVATGAGGATTTQTTNFTTRPSAGWNRTYASVYLRDGATYGVGMPVVIEFDTAVPETARAAVQRRLFVKSEPAQAGGWHWYSGRVAMYRPMSLWTPGTKLTVRVAVAGLPIGNRIGDSDEAASVTIGRNLTMEVDNATKHLNVVTDGNVIRSIPVSLGKPSTPSSSGTMVVMSKEASTVFDTTRTDGPNGYRLTVHYAQRLTWGGEYIHAAPWSEGDQGHRNVSHGCINVSTHNAQWLFETTLIGDPISIRGTETTLTPGNGWTAWNTPWSEFSAGSEVS
jgi:lipoprotein-anchoring transpeptidase ErfK/SrfK